MKTLRYRPVLKWFYGKFVKKYVRCESAPLTWNQLVNMVLLRFAYRNNGLLPEILDGLFWRSLDERYKIQLVSWQLRGYTHHPALIECPQPNVLKCGHSLTPTPLERFPELALRKAVAQHPNTDTAILAVLAWDHEEEVRLAVTQSPAVTPKILDYLAADESLEVRLAVARHPRTEWTTLMNLGLVKYRPAV